MPSRSSRTALTAGQAHEDMSAPRAPENGAPEPGSSSATIIPRKRGVSEEDSSDPLLDNRKRRIGGSSARGVANLTPDQLAKKRANDREAQRAIRERTKNQIDNLERKIKELTSQQPYQELQNVLRQKEIVEAENADMRKRLAQIMDLLNPVVGPSGMDHQRYSSPYIANRAGSMSQHTCDSPSMGSATWHAPPAPMAHDARAQASHQVSRQGLPSLEPTPDRRGLDFILESGPTRSIPPLPNGIQKPTYETTSYPQLPRPEQQDFNRPSQQGLETLAPYAAPTAETATHSHAYSTLPLHRSPKSHVDTVIYDHLTQSHSTLNSLSSTLPMLLGPRTYQFSLFFDPSLVPYAHPLSRLVFSIFESRPDFPPCPEKMAVCYIAYLLLRWEVALDKERYEDMPEWLRPSAGQTAKSHAAWIDLVPWASMREALIEGRELEPFVGPEAFFGPFFQSFSLNWQQDVGSCVEMTHDAGIHVDGDRERSGEEVGKNMLAGWNISPAFEEHVRNLENWTLDAGFEKALPGLTGTYKRTSVERQGHGKVERR